MKSKRYYKAMMRITKAKNEIATEEEGLAVCRLSRIGKKLNRIATNDCNGNPDGMGGQDERRARKNKKDWERLTEEARKIAKKYNWKVKTQGDPRGACLKLSLSGKIELSGRDTDLLYQ